MAEQSWHEARLIPTSGITGSDEQERRATSALLSVMGAVDEFGAAIVKPLGSNAGRMETFIEVPFYVGEKRLYPDGLIRVTRGKRSWTALVEVKTGNNKLGVEQVENYLDVAREQGFDAVLTISNEIPPVPGQHPTKVDGRKLRTVSLHHLPWSQVLSIAVVQKEFRGVADPDQAWILGELIRYLEHSRSGALEFNDMGDRWTGVRDAVTSGTIRASDKGVVDVVTRFDALLRFAGLALGRRLGIEALPVLSRREMNDPSLRVQSLADSLVDSGQLCGAIRVPDTIGDLVITADLRAKQVSCHVDVDAPGEGRSATRVRWLTRQLKGAPDAVRVESFFARSRGAGSAELLVAARENPGLLVGETGRELKGFRVATSAPMGSKRGRGRGSFIDSVLQTIDGFYGDVLSDLTAWSAAPPRLRRDDEVESQAASPASLSSTDLSSQDGPEAPGPAGTVGSIDDIQS